MPIFGEKLKTAPPSPKEIGCRSCEVHVLIRPEKALEFPILAGKSISISAKTFFFLETTCFWAAKTLEFPILAGKSVSISVKIFFFFFFLETTCFWAEKTFEFPSFREIPSQFSDKPCDSDSRAIKIRVKVVCIFLTLSKKPPPPPFPNPGYAPGCSAYLSSCHRTASDAKYWTIRALFIAVITLWLEESAPA